jgi:hypothetical protein
MDRKRLNNLRNLFLGNLAEDFNGIYDQYKEDIDKDPYEFFRNYQDVHAGHMYFVTPLDPPIHRTEFTKEEINDKMSKM